MVRARSPSRVPAAPDMRPSVGPLVDPRMMLPVTQVRTCSSCGRHTTFVLEDGAGGWYVCRECGRFA